MWRAPAVPPCHGGLEHPSGDGLGDMGLSAGRVHEEWCGTSRAHSVDVNARGDEFADDAEVAILGCEAQLVEVGHRHVHGM